MHLPPITLGSQANIEVLETSLPPSAPDLLVVFGPRSLLSIVGIVVLVAGVWHVDRTWDEKGSKAYARAAKDASSKGEVVIPQKDLDEAFPFPWAFLLGWLLYATSYLFPVGGSSEMEVTSAGLLAAFFSLALGVIASIPMGEAVKNRNGPKKLKLGMLFVLSWVMLTLTTISTNPGGVSRVTCPLGAASIVASMKILWKYRKMGDSWEQRGEPNPNPIVYNMGGPLFVFGWFLFWIGLTATATASTELFGEDNPAVRGLPIYLTWRTALAFVAGCGMVPIVLIIDYAHDEGGEYVGFGTDGKNFGRFFETPIMFILAWTLFGLSALMPLDDDPTATTTTRQWIILINCILQSIDAGLLIQTSLYKGDMAGKTRWSIPFVLLFFALAINVGWDGGVSRALALPGAILIIAGQVTVFGDRKRGDYFMINHKPNPNPVVYSPGEPLFMTGWILMSWAMSLPM